MRVLNVFGLLIAASVAASVWFAPGYIDINIPVARHKGGMGFWSESHRTELAYEDAKGVLYVYRKVGSTSDAHDWTTPADAYAYFDEQLRRHGWLPASAGIHDAVAPESRLLGADNHKQYYRPWDKRHRAHLTLSIWPKQISGFNVALTTANESLLMRIARDID
jgi:hypothetical protein